MKVKVIIFLFLLLQACKKNTTRRAVRDVADKNTQHVWYKHRLSFEEKQIRTYVKRDTSYQYQVSDLGFFYAYKHKKNEGIFPKKGDFVFFSWSVRSIDGQVIYDEEALGIKEVVVGKSDVIRGLRAGIKLMRAGEEVRFVFSSYMAYGVTGDGGKVGLSQPIVVDVRLLGINETCKY